MSHKGFSHIGLSTLDLDTTREFYEGVLGFKPVVADTIRIEEGGHLRHLFFDVGRDLFTSAYPHIVGVCVEVVQLVYKAAGGGAVYQKGPLDRCLRDLLTMNQHVVGTLRTYEMAGRLLLGLEPLRWLF